MNKRDVEFATLMSVDGSTLDIGWKPRDARQRLRTDADEYEWLIVHGRVVCAAGRWKFADAGLTESEAAALARYLNARPWVSGHDIEFIEPNLSFFSRGESCDLLGIAVRFIGEVSPPWIIGDADRVWREGFTLEMRVTPADLRAFAAGLSELLGLSG